MRIAVLGGGMMGEALISGLQQITPEPEIVVAEKSAERAADLRERLRVEIAEAGQAVIGADAVILVVKPQDTRALLEQVGAAIEPDAVVLSIAVGIPTTTIESLAPQARVVRAMPNTPARIGAGVTGVSAGASCDAAGLELAEELMRAVGTVLVVPEPLQDAISVTSGSGPAYFYYLAESLIATGEELGLSPSQAREAVVGTMLGAARLLAESGEDPVVLRRAVTSPNGTTAAAIGVLDEAEVPASIRSALLAARDRSQELAQS